MSTTNGNMKSFKVTDKNGNIFIMTPVDTEARQAIDEAKNLQFDEDYFTAEVSQDETTVNVGLNGVPIGLDSDTPLKFVQDNAQGIVIGSDAPFSTAIAPEYDATSTYAVGDNCMHLGKYYECNTAISTAEAWDSTHWSETDIETIISTSGKIVVFECTDGSTFSGPSVADVANAITNNKTVVLKVAYSPGIGTAINYYIISSNATGPSGWTTTFNCSNGKILSLDGNGIWTKDTYSTSLLDGGNKTESDLVSGVLSIDYTNSLTKLTLTTVQALTIKANSGIPNFALEIDNTGNSNDVTVTVTDVAGTNTLNYSTAGGNVVGAGKYMQLTCVGNCWTLAEFTVPTP